MRIRTLDQDLNANQLQVMWGGNGDVYVTIFVNNSGEARDKYCGIPISVRVGMGGSGMRLPRKIGDLLGELATEFEKYNDNLFESDAEEVDFKKRCEELRKQGEWNIEDAKRKSLSLNEYAIILKGKRYNLVKPNLEGCKYCALDKFCDRFKESLCDAMVGEDKGLIFESEKK